MDNNTVEQMQFSEIRIFGNNRRPNSQRKILLNLQVSKIERMSENLKLN